MLWCRPIGRGYSGIIAAEGRVFTQTQTLTDQVVLALDAESGETLWQYRYGWPYEPGGMYPGPRATPTYAKGHIYFAAPDGLVLGGACRPPSRVTKPARIRPRRP